MTHKTRIFFPPGEQSCTVSSSILSSPSGVFNSWEGLLVVRRDVSLARENINRNIKYPDIFQKSSHFSAYVQALTSI